MAKILKSTSQSPTTPSRGVHPHPITPGTFSFEVCACDAEAIPCASCAGSGEVARVQDVQVKESAYRASDDDFYAVYYGVYE